MRRTRNGGLTSTELKVLQMVAWGYSDREISAITETSVRTVHTHVENLRRKIGARSRSEAAAMAVREGWIE